MLELDSDSGSEDPGGVTDEGSEYRSDSEGTDGVDRVDEEEYGTERAGR